MSGSPRSCSSEERSGGGEELRGVTSCRRSLGIVEVDAAYGLADRAHAIPMTVDTQLGMASGSKTFTALVVMRLVEQGLMSLSTAAREVLGADLPLIADAYREFRRKHAEGA